MDQSLARTIAIGVGIAGLSFVVGVLVTGKQLAANKPSVILVSNTTTTSVQSSEVEQVEEDKNQMVNEARDLAKANTLSVRQLLASTTPDSKGQRILTNNLEQALRDACVPEVENQIYYNQNPGSDTRVQYFNNEHGVSFAVPYNNKWVGNNFALAPFSTLSHLLDGNTHIAFAFGRPVKVDRCWVFREFTFTITDYGHSVANSGYVPPIVSTTTKKIGATTYEVVRFQESNMDGFIRQVNYRVNKNWKEFDFQIVTENVDESYEQLERKLEAVLQSVVFFDPNHVMETGGGQYLERKKTSGENSIGSWYENSKFGFGLYAQYWDTKTLNTELIIAPFEVAQAKEDVKISFGHSWGYCREGCASFRSAYISTIPQRSGSQIQQQNLTDFGGESKRIAHPRFEVWEYYQPQGPSCLKLTYEVVGASYNYQVYGNECGSRGVSEIPEMKSALDSLVVFPAVK